MLAYVSDDRVKSNWNQRQQNCWEVYIREICEMLGARATVLSLDELEQPETLAEVRILILGSQSGETLTSSVSERINHWVYDGGVLIGFDVRGLDPVFGIRTKGQLSQVPDDYSIAGLFELLTHPLTDDIHPILFSDQKLLILSDIRIVELDSAVEVGRLYGASGEEPASPAVTWHAYGSGYAGYFAFDLAKTVWLLHQGKPLAPGGNDVSKTSMLSVIQHHSRKVPYADILSYILQNMISSQPVPFIYQIPPQGEQIPDALLYWTGDEYYGPADLSLQASDFMKEKGLAYHINMASDHPVTGKGHPLTQEELRRIQGNGHEVSLWFYMRDENQEFEITEERIKRQLDLFEARFGYRPITTLMHATNWQGWAEPARWLAQQGSLADGSFFSAGLSGDHPRFNNPNFGFGFGTSFPFYFYENYERNNERLGLMEQPIICYELGHRGSIARSEVDKTTAAPEDVHLPIDMAVKYHMTMNFFYHPVYIVQFPRCREAIDEIVRYIEYKRAHIVHMGNDQLCRWWNARSLSDVRANASEGSGYSITADCQSESGMIVKLALPEEKQPPGLQITSNGQELIHHMKWEFGRNWLFIVVPHGQHEIEIRPIVHN